MYHGVLNRMFPDEGPLAAHQVNIKCLYHLRQLVA